MERAVELDPFNPLIQAFNGNHLWMVGRRDEALLEFQRLVRTVPNHPAGLSGLQLLYAAKGMYEEAFSAATSLWAVAGFSEAQQALAQGYAEGGYEEAMRRLADTLVALSDVTWVMPTDVALFYGLAGEENRALAWLERGLEARDPGLPYISAMPSWDGMRDDPRFQDLLLRMGLPE
jgi:tetratricopeptide (TPR) repeat protein